MTDGNKITFAINANQTKKNHPQIDGMIALKKIENYSYALTDEIGLGYSSHVYKGKNDLTNQIVAIKVIDLKKEDELNKQFINEEIAVLEKIKSKNVTANLLKLYDVFKTKNNLYIITEFCEGKDMAKILRKKKKLSEVEAQSIMKQLLKGYDQLYQLGIVHRDLKLANIFIKKGVVKLADFGFAISSQKCHNKFEYNVGSPYYMPPQSLKFNRYSFKSDVWGMGIIAFELLFGKLPWKEKIESILFQKITNTPIEQLFQSQTQMSDQYRNFIVRCLQVDYDKRANPQFIINYQWNLASDYVQGFNDVEGYKPLSMAKLPSAPSPSITTKNFLTSQAIDDENNKNGRRNLFTRQITHQLRDKSPSSRGQFGRQLSNLEQPFALKPTIYKQRQEIIQASPIAIYSPQKDEQVEQTILGQIHYCRFLSSLYDILSQINIIPQGFALKSQIRLKIIQKLDGLIKLTFGDNSQFKIDGFPTYTYNERWSKLKQIIQSYDKKIRQRLSNQFNINNENEQTLTNSIKYLAINLQTNFTLIEQLTYYYQLKDLQKRQNLFGFALYSKIQLLAGRKILKNENGNQINCERLSNKLTLLGIE